MKITSICAKGFLGADDVSIDMREPVLLVAGPNAAGKSSIRDAIALAMTADLCRVKLKGDAGDLVTDGYQSAAVLIGTEQDGDYSVEITKAGKIKDGSKGRETPPALPILLDPERFATMSPADRQSLLYTLLQVDMSHTGIAAALIDRGMDKAKVEAVTPLLRSGFEAGARHAKEQASQARGAWKAITGETYGATKAEGWKPEAGADGGDRAAKLAANAKEKRDAAQAVMDDLQNQAGALRHAAQLAAKAAADLQGLRESAAKEARILAYIDKDRAELQQWKDRLAELPPLPGAQDAAKPLACPDCGTSLVLRNGVLVHYEPPQADDAETAVNRREWTNAVDVMGRSVANAERDLEAARKAKAKIAEIEANASAEDPQQDLAKLEARIAEQKHTRDEWDADYRKHSEASGAAETLAKAEGKAASHHADVKAWSAIAEALEPSGIQGEMLTRALAPFNEDLQAESAAAGFASVQIRPDMTLTYDGRRYGLLSKSEKWRVHAVTGAVIASVSGLRLLVLDEFDVLEVPARGPAIRWLAECCTDGYLQTAIVIGTLKQAPKALPEGCFAHWIDRAAGASDMERAA